MMARVRSDSPSGRRNGPRTRAGRALLFVACTVASAGAASTADKLHRFIDTAGQGQNAPSGIFIDVVTPIVERLAVRGIDFPLTATTPGVSYRFNYDLGVPERVAGSIGPVFAESAVTVGQRRVDLGLSYLYADLTRFEGEDLAAKIRFDGSFTRPGGFKFVTRLAARDFSLVSHLISFSATYGLTDRWDVNALVPLVWTRLRLDGTGSAGAFRPGGRVAEQPVRFDENAFGFGDVFLRTKYRWLEGGVVDLASAFTVRVPSGDVGNFHGIGDTSVLPAIVVSRGVGHQDFHGSLGVEVNADDLGGSRARYTLGATLQPSEGLAFLVDLIGTSSFVDDEFAIPTPAVSFHGSPISGTLILKRGFGLKELVRSVEATRTIAFVPRSDVVDLAVGVKMALVGTSHAYASAIVPLTSDGLRAEVIPAAGVEVGF